MGRIVNAHYQLTCNRRISLQTLKGVLNNSKLHLGHPTITCRLMKKHVQFFPKGSVQHLGEKIARCLVNIFQEIFHLLNLCISISTTTTTADMAVALSDWCVKNIVIHFSLKDIFIFQYIACSGDVTYELELLPVLPASKRRTACVTLFPNGNCIVTGIPSYAEAKSIVNNLLISLSAYKHFCKYA